MILSSYENKLTFLRVPDPALISGQGVVINTKELLSHTTDCMALYHPTHPSLPCTEPFPPPSPMEFHVKCGVHEELCELSGEARIGELRRVVRGVVAAHLSGVGDAFEMRLVPEGISLDDDESVAHLSAGGCVEAVVSLKAVAVQELAKRGIGLCWSSVVTATLSHSYDVVGWLLQAGVNFHNAGFLTGSFLFPMQDATVLNLIVDHDIILNESALMITECRKDVTTLVDATLARGSDRFKNHLLKALLTPVTDFLGRSDSVLRASAMEKAVPYCEALIPVSPLDGTVTVLCGREDLKQFVNLLSMLLEHGAAVDSDVLLTLRQGIPLETLQLLVQKGADPNVYLRKNQSSVTYLYSRPFHEMLNMEESLLACGMDIDTVCSDRNNTVLARYVQHTENHGSITELVSLGANPNVFDECGDTLTMHVAKNRSWRNLQALLQSDRLDINQKSANGQTVLMYIAGKAALCGMGLVFEATTPDLEVEDTKGWTCLAHAASSRKVSAVKLLLEHGAKVGGGVTTALEQAVVKGSLDLCEVLLDNGADPLHMTSGGMTCLALAESYSEETASLLRGRLAKTPPGQESRGVKRKREELEVEEATETAEEEQGSEEEEDATEHSCRECGVAQTAAGVPFASEASVRRHVSSKHRMKWSDYLARYEE